MLPNCIIKYIFSYLNNCYYKNKNQFKIYLLSKFYYKYYKSYYSFCSIKKFFDIHCKNHYEIEYIDDIHDAYIIHIGYKYKDF
jgi:hypothetical protein